MLDSFAHIPRSERVIVALDCPCSQALGLAAQLQGHAHWLKVGMTLYYEQGPAIVQTFKEMGFKVFLDLKFFDIPHQVCGAARSAAHAGADMITMHASGGSAMMSAALEGIQDTQHAPITLAITVLTSFNDETLQQTGVDRPLATQVESLALLAQSAGLSGVVASPHEAKVLRELLGPSAYIVTPGVRPFGSSNQDQNRVALPHEAFDNGASHIVIGRPIVQADNPVEAFKNIAFTLDNC